MENMDRKKIGKIAGVVVIALLVVLVLSQIFSRSPKDCVKDFYKAEQKTSASDMLDLVPKKHQKALMKEYDLSKKELKETVQDYLNDNLDEWEAFYGDNVKVKLKFKNKEKASRDDIKTANKALKDADVNLKVKKSYTYRINLTFTGDDSNESTSDIAYAIKIGGKWYSSEAINFVTIAAAS